MAKKLNYADMAVAIITQLGTQENLTNVNHCATRLRVVVRDPSRVDAAALKKIDGVLGVEVRENQVQVIVGQIIEDLFLEVEKRVGKTSAGGAGKPQEKKLVAVFSNFLQLMAGIMSPVIPSLIAAGFLTCLLLLLNLVFGLESTNSTYVILNNLAHSVLLFPAGLRRLYLGEEIRYRAGAGDAAGVLAAVPGLGRDGGSRRLHELFRYSGAIDYL